MLKNTKYPFLACVCIIDVKFTPKGYLEHIFSSLIAVIYITLQDNIKSIIAVIKPHDATTKGKDNIPAPIVVPIIKKIEPTNLVFIILYTFFKSLE
ncbi:MAG: hypothetical protein Kow0076_0470 [Francisella sp.]